MVVIHARYKAANHKGVCFEGLVDWWWLMDSARDRFEIMNRHGVREVITVPSDYIKRMRGVHVIVQLALFLDANGEFTNLIKGFQTGRRSHVTFTIRAVFKQLPEMIAVPFGCVNRMCRFCDEQAIGFRCENESVDDASGDNQVIT